MRLSEKTIKTLNPPAKGNRITYDEELPGFGLRVTAAGAKAFVLTYWLDGRQRRLTVGRWPTWNATGARERAKALRRQIDSGEDPLAEKKQRREAPTVSDIAREYLARHSVKKKTGHLDKEYINRDILPEWGHLKAADLERREIVAVVERKAVGGAPIAANKLLSTIKGMLNWAVENEYLEVNPAARVKAPGDKQARDRWLNEAEIRAVWTKLDTAKMQPEYRTALRMILASGQRPGEVLSAEWREIDVDNALWVIPAAKSKNGKQQTVPLSKTALALLKPLPRGVRWLFPGAKGSHLTVKGMSNAVLMNREHFGIPRWTPHDCRRSTATHLAKLGVSRLIIERVLNHTDRTVTATYDQHSYDDQKRQALMRWSDKLQQVITGKKAGKVVSIG